MRELLIVLTVMGVGFAAVHVMQSMRDALQYTALGIPMHCERCKHRTFFVEDHYVQCLKCEHVQQRGPRE